MTLAKQTELLRRAKGRRGGETHEHPAPVRRDIIWNVRVGDMVYKSGHWWWVTDSEALGRDDNAQVFVMLQSSDPARSSVTDSGVLPWDKQVRVRRYSRTAKDW